MTRDEIKAAATIVENHPVAFKKRDKSSESSASSYGGISRPGCRSFTHPAGSAPWWNVNVLNVKPKEEK